MFEQNLKEFKLAEIAKELTDDYYQSMVTIQEDERKFKEWSEVLDKKVKVSHRKFGRELLNSLRNTLNCW